MQNTLFDLILDAQIENGDISQEQENLLKRAMKSLSIVCDGARDKDSQGFNASHSKLGKQLASLENWDKECLEFAYSLAVFYQKQLAHMGYSIQEIKAIPLKEQDIVGASQVVKEKTRLETTQKKRNIKVAGNNLIISFERTDPQFGLILELVRSAQGKFFDNATKSWKLPLRKENLSTFESLLEDYEFNYSSDVPSAIAAMEQDTSIPIDGHIKPHARGIEVSFEYDSAKVAKIKSLAGIHGSAKFDPATKSWICPMAMLAALHSNFPTFELHSNLSEELKLSLVAKEVALSYQDSLKEKVAEFAGKLGNEILLDGKQARNYQVEGACFLVKEQRAILAYDVGLGKTLTALLAGREIGHPIIVVCPASVRTNWGREAIAIGMTVKTFSWAKFPEDKELPAKFTLILDECHKAKNLKTAQTKNAIALAAKAQAVFMLTGTPLPNGRPIETFPLLLMANSRIASSKSYYEKRYCAAKQTRFGWDNSGASNLDEWSELVKDKLLHKKKEDCLKSLPDLMRALVTVDGTDAQNKEYKEKINSLYSEYQDRLNKGEIKEADALVLMGILRRVSSNIKIHAAIEKAQEILDSSTSDKVLIFTDFIESAKAIAAHFKADLISGEVDSKKRQVMVDTFTERKDRRVLVATIKAAGEGLNIQAANHIIMVDRTFVPKDYIQAEGRLHKSGQQRTVFSWWLQYNSSDQRVDDLIMEKQERIELALEGERKTMRGIASPGAIAMEALKYLFQNIGAK